NSGLYVFIPYYVRACYLEGTVVDSFTHAPLLNAAVTILSDEIILPTNTKPDGTFKMGKAVPGHFQVRVTKEGYFDKILDFDFVNGQLLSPVIELRSMQTFSLGGKVVRGIDHSVIPFAKVLVHSNGLEFETEADANGDFLFPSIYEGTYELEAGTWNYIYEEQVDLFQPFNMTLEAKKGYQDDFDLDLRWTISGNATQGAWVRDKPETELLFNQFTCGSDGDSQNDNGPYCFSTGMSSPSGNVAQSEVSGGTTWLASPLMDFSSMIDPKISFDYWLCEFPPNQYDGVYVWLTNGVDTFQLDELRNDTINGSWQSKTYDHLALEAPLNEYQFLVSARDTTTGSNFFIVKMHLDNFRVEEGASATEDEMASSDSFLFYPNPLSGSKLYLKSKQELKGNEVNVQVVNPEGSIVLQQKLSRADLQRGIDVKLPEGIYFIQWKTEKGEGGVEKLIVVK
ncbi:MAG TPA: carboxypeptidase regulatory-like domain-containing protein, partial [Saprospiraceae bacterium]|nr:carboxypeptidase regulatory-like domain-containing protein [Saprospiraceae bacterium]